MFRSAISESHLCLESGARFSVTTAALNPILSRKPQVKPNKEEPHVAAGICSWATCTSGYISTLGTDMLIQAPLN